jgi:hypothetical protein
MLLRLAGALPDDTLARCRDWLAGGELVELGRAVLHAVRPRGSGWLAVT